MGTLYVDTLEPQSGTTLTVGETGQNTVVGGNTIKFNTLQDAGGNAIFTSNGSGVLSSVNSSFGSAMVLLSTQTASDSASLSITSDITSTYKQYIFKFYNINPATNNAYFTYQCSTDSGSSYGITCTASAFWASHNEADSAAELIYDNTGNYYKQQATTYQAVCHSIQNDADASMAGELHLFQPSSTTYIKNWFAKTNTMGSGYTINTFTGGYFNTTTALDAINFKMSSGNITAGKVKMFGIK